MALFPSMLTQTLALLTKSQQRRLRLFVGTSLHNTRQDVALLVNALLDLTKPGAAHEAQVWKKVFVSEPFSEKQARYIQSFSFGVVQDFLVWEAYHARPYGHHAHLRTLLQPSTSEVFKYLHRQTTDELNRQSLRDADFHLSSARLHELNYEQQVLHRRQSTDELTASSKHLTIFYIAENLRLSCAFLLHDQMQGNGSPIVLLNEVIQLASNSEFAQEPVVKRYYHAYMALLDATDDFHAAELLDVINSQHGLLDNTEARNLVLIGINACIRRINTGRITYLDSLMQLFELGLQREVFFEGGYLSRFTFNNIVVAALRLKRYAWVEQFVTEYAPRINPKYRDGAVNYNRALIAYQQHQYDEALEWLRQISNDDTLHQLDARRILLRIYYDLDEYQALDSLLTSFRLYLYRRRDLGYHRQHYVNLIRFLRTRIRIRKYDKAALKRLRERVAACPSVAERQWLLETVCAG